MIDDQAASLRIQHLFCNIISSLKPSLTSPTSNHCIVYLSLNLRESDTERSMLNYTFFTELKQRWLKGPEQEKGHKQRCLLSTSNTSVGNILFQWPVGKKDLNPPNCQTIHSPSFIKEWFWCKDTKELNGNESRNPGSDYQNTFKCLKSMKCWKLWGFMFNFEVLWRCPTRKGNFRVSLSIPLA